MKKLQEDSWNKMSQRYQSETYISCQDFHYGPLLPGDSELRLLPRLNGLRCLELACGGAQNSIFLASRGAKCVALDIAESQLAHAEQLASEKNVRIELKKLAMENISRELTGKFDLIHSVYGLPFAVQPDKVIAACAKLLAPGGLILFSLPHPLYAGEYLCLNGDAGMFIESYFEISPDIRYDDAGGECARSNYFSVEQVAEWLSRSGLLIERILEPRPSDSPAYTSAVWEEYREQFERFPGTIIFKAIKPLHPAG